MSLDSVVGEDLNRQMYIQTVYYKGNTVAMKEVKNTNISRSLMMELKVLKDLQNEHIVRFIGACFDQGE